MPSTRQPTLAAIAANPTLHPRAFALVQERYAELKWHSHADSPESSQAFALSAFIPLLDLDERHQVVDAFVTTVLLGIPRDPDRKWSITPEFTSPTVLGETGLGVPTNVDILLTANDAVVCVESKFKVDALEGFGRCSQFSNGVCGGFHGVGSDSRGSDALCRLGVSDGRRHARLYWTLGEDYFRQSIYDEQVSGEVCPYRDNYQAMRNFLLAARLAESEQKPHFGVIALVPKTRDAALRRGVERFQEEVLLPQYADGIVCAHYEDYIRLLGADGSESAQLAKFLEAILREN